ncbi:MAG: FliA/WhiG family RNA polymerase sigma factor [Acidimicrobiales bacterium]
MSTADEAEVLVDSEDDEPVGNTMTPAEINALIEEHVPLVKHIVFQVAVHFPRHVEREELARAGALGLVEAAQRYSPERGIPFQRFAARRVRGAMIDSVRAADWAPRSVRRLSRRFDAMEQQLASELGRAPQTKETAEALGMKPEEVSKLRSQLYRSVVLALEQDVGGESGEDLNLLDILPDRANLEPDEQLEGRELYAYLQDAISLLPERHRLVIVGYFLEEKTSAELARFLGVTESRVSQLRSDAVEMLRQGITSQYEDVEADSEKGLRAERRKKCANAIGEASDWRDRLDEGAELSTDIRTVL